MAARLNAPVLGAAQTYGDKGTWASAVSWRYQKSDRHFVGSDEQEERKAEGSEVINWVNQLELTVTRNFSKRWSLTAGSLT